MKKILTWIIVVVLVALVIWAIVAKKDETTSTDVVDNQNTEVVSGDNASTNDQRNRDIRGSSQNQTTDQAVADALADALTYTCDNGNIIIAKYITASDGQGVVLSLKDGSTFGLKLIESANGEKYTDGKVQFFADGNRQSAIWVDEFKYEADCVVS